MEFYCPRFLDCYLSKKVGRTLTLDFQGCLHYVSVANSLSQVIVVSQSCFLSLW